MDFIIISVSIFDTFILTEDIPVIKVMRLLHTLRPLQFISHNKHMKLIVTALLHSFESIMNVLAITFLIWLMFAILGISLLADRMGYCKMEDYYNIS